MLGTVWTKYEIEIARNAFIGNGSIFVKTLTIVWKSQVNLTVHNNFSCCFVSCMVADILFYRIKDSEDVWFVTLQTSVGVFRARFA